MTTTPSSSRGCNFVNPTERYQESTVDVNTAEYRSANRLAVFNVIFRSQSPSNAEGACSTLLRGIEFPLPRLRLRPE